MSEEEPKALEPEVLAVLLAAQPLTEVPEAAKVRMRSAVEARIRAVPPSWIASHPWIALPAVFVLGSVVGFFARGARPDRIVYVPSSPTTAPMPIPVTAPPSSEVSGVPAEQLPQEPAASPSVRKSPAPPPDTGEQLAAESALLDVARTAVARGEPDRALDAVARHASQFPHGLLTEEREALAIKALVLDGKGPEARDRASVFRAHYPSSMFLRSIDASLRTIP